MSLDDKVKRFEKLTELKNKLYELHGVDKFEAMTEIYNEIRKHDKELADTLTLITSDFNTQLNIQQNHFVNILDNLITLEEKRLISEVGRVPNSRATDKEGQRMDRMEHSHHHSEEVINVNPVINITTTQDNNNNNNSSPAKKEGFLSEGTLKLLTEYKLLIFLVFILIVLYYDPGLIEHAAELLKNLKDGKE